MAEIRVRDASPQLIKGMEEIALDVREATIAGALVKLITRYHDQKKRIKEQEDEIRKLSADLRSHDMNKSSMLEQFDTLAGFIRMHGIDNSRLYEQVVRMQKRFGTKKQRPASPRGAKKRKIVPAKSKKK